jgi:amino acid permease
MAASIPGAHLLEHDWIRFAVLLIGMFPLCLTRTLSGLAAATSFCFGCIVVVAVIVVWMCTAQFADTQYKVAVTVERYTSLEGVLQGIPIFATSLFGHMNFPRLYAELRTEVKDQAEAVSFTALVLLCCLLLGFGLAGYMAFGVAVQDDIVEQLAMARGEGWGMATVQALMLIFVICKTPLIVFPMRAQVLATLRPGAVLSDLGVGENVLLTLALLMLVYVVACLLPNLSLVMTIVGALCVVPLTFIFPARLQQMAEPVGIPWRSGMLGMVGALISGLSFYAFSL